MRKYSAIPTAQLLSHVIEKYGIRDIVISPGSRNAPLTLQFSENPNFKCYSIVDERVAGFFALGMAQKTRRPVVLLCTSGSALLNYYPAVAEAFYSAIPLVVVSADRPSHKIDIGDGQTIRQEGVYGKHVHCSCTLQLGQHVSSLDHEVDEEKKGDDLEWDVIVDNANHISMALKCCIEQNGPVHINVPFEEPLYTMIDKELVFDQVKYPVISNHSDRGEMVPHALLTHWKHAKKIMFLVGVLAPNELEESLINQLVEEADVLFLTETTSNCHRIRGVYSIDQLIAPLELTSEGKTLFSELQPDLLITMGGMVVSKKIKQFLRKYPPQHHYHIGSEKFRDTFYCLDENIDMPINQFLKDMLSIDKAISHDYGQKWLERFDQGLGYRSIYSKEIPYSDFKVFGELFSLLPDELNVHFANSSTIRYAQLFPMKKSWEVHCNRGTSGIDGSISTAVGSAVYSDKTTLIITGDLSFFYDSNALWTDQLQPKFKIILINNSGGGIFRILPGDKHQANFKKFFETRHQLNASHIAKMYGMTYISVSSQQAIRQHLVPFMEDRDQPGIFEIFTPTEVNDKVLLGYFEFLAEKFRKL